MNKVTITIGVLLGLGIVGYLVYNKMKADGTLPEALTPTVEPTLLQDPAEGRPNTSPTPNPIPTPNAGNGSDVGVQLGISPVSKFNMVGQKSIGSGAEIARMPIKVGESQIAYLERVSSACLNNVRCKAFTNQGKLYNATTNVFDTTNTSIKLYVKA